MQPIIYSGEERRWHDLQQEHVLLMMDEHTYGFCLPVLLAKMPFLAHAPRLVVPAGEAAKTQVVCSQIWSFLQDQQSKQHSVLVALGGGALCDVAAFCASVFKRGMRLRLIPTTLLCMVDAAIGGKTAIDFGGIKNLIGSFYPAESIYVQSELLKTLPARERNSGVAEMIKHQLIADAEAWQRSQDAPISDYFTEDAIRHSQEIKLRFVAKDPYDKADRQALNFGHSIGHAVESISMQTSNPMLHGEAIMFGMQVELFLSVRHCGLATGVWEDYKARYRRLFPEAKAPAWHADDLMPLLWQDKKNQQSIRMSLISSPGCPKWQIPVSPSSIVEAIHENCFQ